MLEQNVEYKVKGYTNKWSLIDTYEGYGLLENCTYGDETCYLVVDLEQEPVSLRYKTRDGRIIYLPTILDVICETYDGIEIALEDACLIS